MSSSTPNAQSLTAAELQVLFGPINTFLTELQRPDVNIQAVAQGWAQLQLAELQNEPLAQSVGISNIAAIAQAKINAIEAKLTATPQPAVINPAAATGTASDGAGE